MRFDLHYTDGAIDTYEADSYEDLLAELTDNPRHDGWVIGHDGDLSDHGDRTLIWASLEDATDDDGYLAIAEIRVAS